MHDGSPHVQRGEVRQDQVERRHHPLEKGPAEGGSEELEIVRQAPTTTRARVKMALRVGVEKVEKRTAMAVTTISLTKVRPTGSSSSQVSRPSIAEAMRTRPAPMIATFTARVSVRPRNFPRMKSARRIGLVMMV